MRAFGVGFKNHVEIRISDKPLKEEKSSVTRTIKGNGKPKPTWWSNQYDGKWEGDDSKYTMKSVVYLGGKVVNVVKARSFTYHTKLKAPTHGQMVEFDYTIVSKFKRGKDD